MPDLKPSPAENLKSQSRRLRGTIAEELQTESPQFSKPAVGLLKFHGIYQQDDRDLRKSQPDRVYSSMVRIGIPGGLVSSKQYLELDRLAGEVGDETLRITSRQDVQYHYVGKRNLKTLIRAVNEAGLSTLAACGDVVRNVTYDSTPVAAPHRADIMEYVRLVACALKPKSRAYVEIWLDGEKAASIEEESEPLYGDAYLPRKFKIAFTFPGENLIDIYSNDLGFVPRVGNGEVQGFTVLAGGGMGQSNGVKLSHPRMADPVCSIGPSKEEVLAMAKAVVSIHRDFGNRSNRRLARLKYVLDERGLDWFKTELSSRLGAPLAPSEPLSWRRQEDYLGWNEQAGGGWFYGLRVISGRLKGAIRAAVREVVEATGCDVRFTVQQNLLFTGLNEDQRTIVDQALARHGVADVKALPPVLRQSMACPALPTCGQAITESERVLPSLAEGIQAELNAAGLGEQPVVLRMTGCPNGCARPYTAEIGIVGESVELYTIYLGGSPVADRLARPWKRLVKLGEIPAILRPLMNEYKSTRTPGEPFGDWCARSLELGSYS
ncbi:MAG: NADPH-dependent assimilatory sulfite reductase hemoprotein subunit [Bryobacteraceae bacterium]|nr:NADPH-dependent assimilatory sulfite reductase hemoprotein subunit [Bryobacteraceae bacterium]